MYSRMTPATEHTDDLVAQQRAGIIVYHLGVLGHCYTTAEIAVLVGVGERGALRIMDNLCASLPLTQVEGRWLFLPEG